MIERGQDGAQRTALHHAVVRGHLDMAEYLVQERKASLAGGRVFAPQKLDLHRHAIHCPRSRFLAPQSYVHRAYFCLHCCVMSPLPLLPSLSICVCPVRDESFQIPMDLAMQPALRNAVFYSPWQIAHGDITAYDPQISKIGGGAFGDAYITTYRRQQVYYPHGYYLWPMSRNGRSTKKRLLSCCGLCIVLTSALC